MKFRQTVIAGVDYHLPEQVITTAGIEDRLAPLYQRFNLSFGRLELMTGIRQLRWWRPGTSSAEVASRAAQRLLDGLGFPRQEIGLLIHASVCRDFLEPASASLVHARLGLSQGTMIFDLSNACLGVLNAMVVAAQAIERRQIPSALIVSGENSGPLIFNTIRSLLEDAHITRQKLKRSIASLTIGSAAVAVLLVHQSLATGKQYPRLLGGAASTDSAANSLCQGDGDLDTLEMHTDAEALLQSGVELAQNNWQKTLRVLEWDNSQVDWALGHQVGSAHQRQVLEALQLQDKKSFVTYPDLGNTGSAALPITWAKLMEASKHPARGEKVALLGIGSGLASLMLGVEV